MNRFIVAAVTAALAAANTLATPVIVGFDGGINVLTGAGVAQFATAGAAAQASFVNDPVYGGGVMTHTAAFGSAANRGVYFDTGAQPNGGGAYINDYTIAFDIRVGQGYNWHSLYQTNETNSNDGDLFLRPEASGGGVGISGQYHGTITPGAFQRFAFTFDTSVPGVELRKYIDGALVGTQTLASGVDGRWSLYSTDDTFFQGLYLLADNSGDMTDAAIGGFLFEDRVYTGGEIAGLGAASYNTLPEPTALALLAAVAAVAGRRPRG